MFQPKTKETEIYNSIFDLIDSKTKPTDIQLARINREISTLSNQKVISYHEEKVLCGLLAAVKGQVDVMEGCFEAALSHWGNSKNILLPYITCLDLCNYYNRMNEIAHEALGFLENDVESLYIIFNAFYHGLDFDGADSVLNQLAKLEVDFESHLSRDIESLSLRHSFVTKYDMQPHEINERIYAINTGFVSKYYQPTHVATEVTDELLTFIYGVDEAEDVIVEMDTYLSQLHAELDYSEIDNYLTFSCIPNNERVSRSA